MVHWSQKPKSGHRSICLKTVVSVLDNFIFPKMTLHYKLIKAIEVLSTGGSGGGITPTPGGEGSGGGSSGGNDLLWPPPENGQQWSYKSQFANPLYQTICKNERGAYFVGSIIAFSRAYSVKVMAQGYSKVAGYIQSLSTADQSELTLVIVRYQDIEYVAIKFSEIYSNYEYKATSCSNSQDVITIYPGGDDYIEMPITIIDPRNETGESTGGNTGGDTGGNTDDQTGGSTGGNTGGQTVGGSIGYIKYVSQTEVPKYLALCKLENGEFFDGYVIAESMYHVSVSVMTNIYNQDKLEVVGETKDVRSPEQQLKLAVINMNGQDYLCVDANRDDYYGLFEYGRVLCSNVNNVFMINVNDNWKPSEKEITFQTR